MFFTHKTMTKGRLMLKLQFTFVLLQFTFGHLQLLVTNRQLPNTNVPCVVICKVSRVNHRTTLPASVAFCNSFSASSLLSALLFN